MALCTIHPTDIDEKIAREVASNTDHRAERIAGAVTWGADEHVLLALAVVGWLCNARIGQVREAGWDTFFCLLARLDRPAAHIEVNDRSGTPGSSND